MSDDLIVLYKAEKEECLLFLEPIGIAVMGHLVGVKSCVGEHFQIEHCGLVFRTLQEY